MIWSAAMASCSIPLVFPNGKLLCKNEKGEIVPYNFEKLSINREFVDGSISADVPRQKVAEMFNVNCFIVSQTNPWLKFLFKFFF